MAPTNEELDSEPDEWEEQQVKKAMTALPDITGSLVKYIHLEYLFLCHCLCFKPSVRRENGLINGPIK